MITLEEQITGLEKMCSNSAEEFRAKAETIATLKKLISVRDHAMGSNPNMDRLADLILSAIGINPVPMRSP